MNAFYNLGGLWILIVFAAILIGFVAWNFLKFFGFIITFKGIKRDKENQRLKKLKLLKRK